jgi:hypothetical protein
MFTACSQAQVRHQRLRRRRRLRIGALLRGPASPFAALSVAGGTIWVVPTATVKDDTTPLVSHTGVPLTGATTFRFTLDVNREQHQRLLSHAGAFRKAFNHQIGRVKANLEQRAAERSYGIAEADLTAVLSWSKDSFINHMNGWKDGRDPAAETHLLEGGTIVRELPWPGEVSADVFETASVNAAQALANWSKSKKGERAGTSVGFPRFKSKHKTTPAFRLRSKYREGAAPAVRPTGPRAVRFPKLGELRVRENTKSLRKLLGRGRFHAYAAVFPVRTRTMGGRGHRCRRRTASRQTVEYRPARVPGGRGSRREDARRGRGRARQPPTPVGGGESTPTRASTPETGQPGLLENQERIERSSQGGTAPGPDPRPGGCAPQGAPARHHHQPRPRIRRSSSRI